MRQPAVAQPPRQPLPGRGAQFPGRARVRVRRCEGDAQESLGQVDRGGLDAEFFQFREPLYQRVGVQGAGGEGRHGQQEGLRAGFDDVDRLGHARREQRPGQGEASGAVRVDVERELPGLIAPHRPRHVVQVGLPAVEALGRFPAHHRLERLGQRRPVAAGVPDQSVQRAFERRHVLIARDDRGDLLRDLGGGRRGTRHRPGLGHRGQHIGERLGGLLRRRRTVRRRGPRAPG